jgi:hypothetical protein
MFRRSLAPALTLCLLLPVAACVAAPPNRPPVPVARYEEVPPPPPAARVVWQPGEWHWDGRQYVWRPGHYVERLASYHRWEAGHWDGRGDWIPGHWV